MIRNTEQDIVQNKLKYKLQNELEKGKQDIL